MCGSPKPDISTVLTLEARDLTIGARIGAATVPAIRGVSFKLAPGKILGLVGESGAGKTMVGRAIAQLLPAGFAATAGTLLFEGEDLQQMPATRRRALLGRAIAMLSAARLPHASDLLPQYPHQLSGGMCQRVLIALAFAGNPRLIVADEPTTALDVTMHPPILRLIAEMQRQHGTAVIFITHDLRLAAQLCDDVIVVYAGRAVESGPERTVLATPAHPYT